MIDGKQPERNFKPPPAKQRTGEEKDDSGYTATLL